MKRVENCVDSKINHVSIIDDALSIDFAKSKGNQDGEANQGPWHMYANASNPEICIFLALARYIFTFPEVISNGAAIFEGDGQYGRYGRNMQNFYQEHVIELRDFGYEPGNLGTHSSRKGVASMITGGCTVCPPIISICLRVGWSYGTVKERYLKYEAAGDQYVGRCASGANQMSKEFGSSPPYFDFTELENEEERIVLKDEIYKWVKDRIVFCDKVPPETFELIIVLFASICFHYQHMYDHLSPSCPLRGSMFFKNVPSKFLTVSVVKYPWNATSETPPLTGIPPHVVLLNDMEKASQQLSSLRQQLKEDLNGMLDERGIGGNEFHTNAILDAISEISRKIHNPTLPAETNEIPEGVPILVLSEDEDDNINDDLTLEADGGRVREMESLKRKRETERSREQVKKRRLKIGYHHGRLQLLPRHWVFPKMTMKQLLENWFIGDATEKVPPLALLKTNDVAHIKTDKDKNAGRNALRKIKILMKVAKRFALEENCWSDKRVEWDVNYVKVMWEKVGMAHLMNKYGGKRKNLEISWKTVCNNIAKLKEWSVD